MEKLALVILAAGLGKRTKTNMPKVLLEADGLPLITHVLETTREIAPDKTVVVTGFKRELVEDSVRDWAVKAGQDMAEVSFAYQEEQLGTGHAVRCGLSELTNFKGTVVILYGDMPLVSAESLATLLEHHKRQLATLTISTMHSDELLAYGRIIRDQAGKIIRIVEAKDLLPGQASIKECNIGIYAVETGFLKKAVDSLSNNNAQKEYYLTDIVEKAVKDNETVASVTIPKLEETLGVNDLYDLSQVSSFLRQKRMKQLLLSGVKILDNSGVLIERSVSIEPGAIIGPNVQLLGKTVIEAGAVLEGTAYLKDVHVRKNAQIKLGVRGEKSEVGESAQVGPFAHLREGSLLGTDSRVGNFVETKKATLEKGVKASHLTYLGDCTIGEDTNIGAGTITCNYDGYRKSKTVIGKNVFVGSDTCLVAPVTIEDGSVIGAGSVITKTVEKDSLALTRAPQVSKPEWASQRRKMAEEKGWGKH